MRKLVFAAIGLIILLPITALAMMSLFSRRPANLGVTDGHLAPCPKSPNCVSSQADDPRHRVEPLSCSGDPDTAFKRLEQVIRRMPRAKIVAADEGYLHAEFTSRLFRYVDDVELLLDPDKRVIHIRSASRAGYSDMGANRQRVEAIRRRFREADDE